MGLFRTLSEFLYQAPPEGCVLVKMEGADYIAWKRSRHFPREYFPNNDPALYREFAGINPDEIDSVLEFAGIYGLLGERAPPREGYVGPADYLGPAERVDAWVREIKHIRQAVYLWDLVRRRDNKTLKRHFQFKRDEGVVFFKHKDLEKNKNGQRITRLHADSEYDPALRYRTYVTPFKYPSFVRYVEGQLEWHESWIGPAQFRVQQLVNQGLRERVSTQLLTSNNGQAGLYNVPHNLIGCLWLQLAISVSEARDAEQCGYCGKWLEISPETRRKNSKWCSNACKNRAYRKRKEAKK